MIQRRTGIRMRGAKVRGSFKTGFRWASGGKTSKQVVILFYLTCEQDRGSVEENCQRDSGECPFGCDPESPEWYKTTGDSRRAGMWNNSEWWSDQWWRGKWGTAQMSEWSERYCDTRNDKLAQQEWITWSTQLEGLALSLADILAKTRCERRS